MSEHFAPWRWPSTRRGALLGAVMALAPAAHAQRASAMPLVGVLSARPIAGNELLSAFRRSLAELGYAEGRTVAIEYRSSEGKADRMPALAAELVRLQPTLIFAASSDSAVTAKAATTTIPIVFAGAADPVRLGLVASLARPEGNLTGASRYSHALGAKRLQLLLALVPGAPMVAVLVNPGNPNAASELDDLAAAASSLNVATTVVKASNAGELERGFAGVAERHLRALYILDDPLFTGRLADLAAALAIRHRIALVSTSIDFVRAGALASYGADFIEVYRQCGRYAGRILNGAKPADLPVVLPTRFSLTINLATAKALGIDVPVDVLAAADEVIE